MQLNKWLGGILVVVAGCLMTNPVLTNEEYLAALRKRAAFDLGCKPESMKLTRLDASDENAYWYQVGVTCDEHHATYLNRAPHGWIMNAQTDAPPSTAKQ